MKPSQAKRFFERNQWKIARERVYSQRSLFGYFNRRKYKKYLKALRKNQANPIYQRAYQKVLWLLR